VIARHAINITRKLALVILSPFEDVAVD
jgi:hypothetical protein